MDYKSMATPMASNIKLFSDASLELFDATMYHEMIGPLMYLTNMIPNICFSMINLSQFLMIENHVVRYLKGTVECELKYYTNQKTNLYGYVDLDW